MTLGQAQALVIIHRTGYITRVTMSMRRELCDADYLIRKGSGFGVHYQITRNGYDQLNASYPDALSMLRKS